MSYDFAYRCTLVGGGPGDPELLTLKAVNGITSGLTGLSSQYTSNKA